jgi:hypothetical protein
MSSHSGQRRAPTFERAAWHRKQDGGRETAAIGGEIVTLGRSVPADDDLVENAFVPHREARTLLDPVDDLIDHEPAFTDLPQSSQLRGERALSMPN